MIPIFPSASLCPSLTASVTLPFFLPPYMSLPAYPSSVHSPHQQWHKATAATKMITDCVLRFIFMDWCDQQPQPTSDQRHSGTCETTKRGHHHLLSSYSKYNTNHTYSKPGLTNQEDRKVNSADFGTSIMVVLHNYFQIFTERRLHLFTSGPLQS